MPRFPDFLLCLAVASPAASQVQASAPTSADCELHIWLSAGPNVVRAHAHDNFTWGFGNDQNDLEEDDNFNTDRTPASPDGPLNRKRQSDLLSSLPLAAMLGLPGYRLVFHSEAMTMTDVRRPTRLSANGPACHAELILTDLTYARVYANGHNLKTFWVLRDFASGNSLVRRAGMPGEARLTVSIDEAKRTETEFRADLERAYQDNLRNFAGNLQPKPKK